MARGDRLAVVRRLAGAAVPYTHHGIDVGDGTVVHARPDDPERLFGGGRVVRTTLAEFAEGAEVRVIHDPPARHPPEEIVERALGGLGRDGYCPVIDNCEHFTTWCATGAHESRQVDLVVERLSIAATRVAAAAAARSAGRVAVRSGLGTAVRLSLGTLLPAALVAEGAAIAAEWSAHQAGHSAARSRTAGEAAGMATSAAVCAAAAVAAGPAAVLGGAIAGAALWITGSAAATVVGRGRRRATFPASPRAAR